MDYKELIKEMREFTYWLGQSGPESHDIHPLVCEKWADAIETLLAEREAAGWISVDDKLPEPHKTVFAHRENGSIELMYLVRYGKWSIPESKYLPRVTHWMPLPTPPDRKQTES